MSTLCTCNIKNIFELNTYHNVGLYSSVGIATGYRLDGLGIESEWRARFSAPVQKERLGRDADPSPPSSAVVKEE